MNLEKRWSNVRWCAGLKMEKKYFWIARALYEVSKSGVQSIKAIFMLLDETEKPRVPSNISGSCWALLFRCTELNWESLSSQLILRETLTMALHSETPPQKDKPNSCSTSHVLSKTIFSLFSVCGQTAARLYQRSNRQLMQGFVIYI